MEEHINKEAKTEVMKDIIRGLHTGLSVEEAKNRFEKEIGNITSTEIAEIEQSLINEGISPDEIKKFCNVHALLFHEALEKEIIQETSASHPIYLFKMENREIEKRTGKLKKVLEKTPKSGVPSLKEKVKEILLDLKGIERHYERKEQLLFPYLESYGFMGPSKVMWGKDNEVRDFLKTALAEIDDISTSEAFESFVEKNLNPLIEEGEGMIFKEENILFPTSLEKLSPGDWIEILRESGDIGYVYIETPGETEALMKELGEALSEEPTFQDGVIHLPSGNFQLTELTHMLNALPFDITFVDKDDTVQYFTEGRDRIFLRTRAIIGRKVQNCHPPQSVDVVEQILTSFKDGKKDYVDFWLNLEGKQVYIRYLAIRDKGGKYLGTVEITQDITEIKTLKGEKRLLDERD